MASRNAVSMPYPASASTGAGQPRLAGPPGSEQGRSPAWSGMSRRPARPSGSPSRVVDLGLGQVEPVGDRQAGVVSGNRQRDRDLAVVLLAELAAILAGDTSVAFHLLRRRNLGYSANRVRALLRHAGCSYRNETDSPAKMVQGRFVIRRGAHEHVGDQIRLDRTWFASAF